MSRRLSYYHAHERAASRMNSVTVTLDCPECGNDVECRVDGNDVTVINGCLELHHRHPAVRELIDGSALAIALGERESYVEHLRGYDDNA